MKEYEMPSSGGGYTRNKDGSLTKIEGPDVGYPVAAEDPLPVEPETPQPIKEGEK